MSGENIVVAGFGHFASHSYNRTIMTLLYSLLFIYYFIYDAPESQFM